jgi:hypothetical protein
MRAMKQETHRGDDRSSSDDEDTDTIDSRADDLHELSKIFHASTLLTETSTIFNAGYKCTAAPLGGGSASRNTMTG